MSELFGIVMVRRAPAGAMHVDPTAGLGAGPSRFLDDFTLHWRERAEQLILLVLRHLELVERTAEVFDKRHEIGAADTHAHVRGLHVFPRVDARSTARHA